MSVVKLASCFQEGHLAGALQLAACEKATDEVSAMTSHYVPGPRLNSTSHLRSDAILGGALMVTI